MDGSSWGEKRALRRHGRSGTRFNVRGASRVGVWRQQRQVWRRRQAPVRLGARERRHGDATRVRRGQADVPGPGAELAPPDGAPLAD